MFCPGCARTVPSDAVFCIYCAAPIGDAATPAPHVRTQPATGPTVRLQPPTVPHIAPRPHHVPVAPAKPQARQHHKNLKKPTRQPDYSGAVFLIGLGVLVFTGNFWPGILILIGVSGFLKDYARARSNHGLGHLVFWVGLAVLWNTPFLWPGVLLLLFASHLIGKQRMRTWI